MSDEIFTIKLDVTISNNLHTTLNDYNNFYFKHKFKKKEKEEGAWNLMCVTVDRISSTAKYLNSLKLGENENGNAFDFFNFTNNAQVLIDCIYTLSEIYDVDICKNKKLCDVFNEQGENKKGTDDDYFKYLRSLCSVHPADTSHYKGKYQRYDFECSPFVIWYENKLLLRIYNQEGNDYDRHIDIERIFKYIESRFNIIKLIIIKMNEYVENTKNNYRNQKIKVIDEFDDYTDYISNLKLEYEERVGVGIYGFEYIIQLIKQPISNENNMSKVELYINAIKYSITFLHQYLQELPDDDISTDLPFEMQHITLNDKYKDYNYHIEKSIKLIEINCDIFDRNLVLRIPIFKDKCINISENESNVELYILLQVALYLDALENENILNKNIPNNLEYRMHLVNEKNAPRKY